MAFTDITPAESFVTTRNSDVISSSEFAGWVTTYRSTALDEMQSDIEMALRIDHDETDILDEIQSDHGAFLNKALAYKMLEHYYNRFHDGDGKNAARYKLYKAEYDKYKAKFGQLYGRDHLSTAATVPIARG